MDECSARRRANFTAATKSARPMLAVDEGSLLPPLAAGVARLDLARDFAPGMTRGDMGKGADAEPPWTPTPTPTPAPTPLRTACLLRFTRRLGVAVVEDGGGVGGGGGWLGLTPLRPTTTFVAVRASWVVLLRLPRLPRLLRLPRLPRLPRRMRMVAVEPTGRGGGGGGGCLGAATAAPAVLAEAVGRGVEGNGGVEDAALR